MILSCFFKDLLYCHKAEYDSWDVFNMMMFILFQNSIVSSMCHPVYVTFFFFFKLNLAYLTPFLTEQCKLFTWRKSHQKILQDLMWQSAGNEWLMSNCHITVWWKLYCFMVVAVCFCLKFQQLPLRSQLSTHSCVI